MPVRRAIGIQATAALAIAGTVAIGGCGSSSSASTTDGSGEEAKTSTAHHGDAVKHPGSSTKR